MIPLYQIIAVQFFTLLAVFVFSHSAVCKRLLQKKSLFVGSVIGILLLQLGFSALQSKEVGDVMLFAGAGWHLRHQIDFYFIDSQHTQYPFFPFLIFVHAVLNVVQEAIPMLTFSFFLKIVLAGALLALSWRIHSEEKLPQNSQRAFVLQFLSHPVTTLVIFFHGQVDVMLLAFLIFSFRFLSLAKLSGFMLSVTFFTASVAAKTWSILLLPFFVLLQPNWQRRILAPVLLLGGLLVNVFVYTRLVDGSSVRTVLPAVTAAGGPIGEWGLSLFFPVPSFWESYGLAILLGVMGLATLKMYWSKIDPMQGLLVLILVMQLALPRWGIQYLFWFIPLLYITDLTTKQRIFITISASLFAFTNYLNIARELEGLPLLFSRSLVRVLGLVCWGTIAGIVLQLWPLRDSNP